MLNYLILILYFKLIVSFNFYKLFYNEFQIIKQTIYPLQSSFHILTDNLTTKPTLIPTIKPTIKPTYIPSNLRGNIPNQISKKIYPSKITNFPIKTPTKQPSKQPTIEPSRQPTITPTKYPTLTPTLTPTISPTTPYIVDYTCQLPLGSSHYSNTNCNNLTKYEYGSTIQIFPDSESNCRCLESTLPYSFTITIRDPNRIMLLFQGGGLCWDEYSFTKRRCRQQASLSRPDGILLPDSNNIFSNYTIIRLLYCTGDLFIGNSTATFSDSTGNITKFNGIENVLFILDWIENQQTYFNSLNLKFDHLVIAGSSAGSIGAQIWSDHIISRFNAYSYTVIADSMLTFMPSNLMYNLYNMWNFCNSTILIPNSLISICQNNPTNFSHVIVMNEIIKNNPAVPYLFIQSKWDLAMRSIYNWSIKFFKPEMNHITANDYLEYLFHDLFILNSQPNFILYLVESTHHLYLYVPEYFTANEFNENGLNIDVVKNDNDNNVDNNSEINNIGKPLYSWIKSIQPTTRDSRSLSIGLISSECVKSNCSSALFPKSFKIIPQ